jgi:hypothetical protein
VKFKNLKFHSIKRKLIGKLKNTIFLLIICKTPLYEVRGYDVKLSVIFSMIFAYFSTEKIIKLIES